MNGYVKRMLVIPPLNTSLMFQLRFSHLQDGERWWRGCLLQVPLQIRPGHPHLHQAGGGRDGQERPRLCHQERRERPGSFRLILLFSGTSTTPSPLETSLPGQCSSRWWPSRRRKTGSSILLIWQRYSWIKEQNIFGKCHLPNFSFSSIIFFPHK